MAIKVVSQVLLWGRNAGTGMLIAAPAQTLQTYEKSCFSGVWTEVRKVALTLPPQAYVLSLIKIGGPRGDPRWGRGGRAAPGAGCQGGPQKGQKNQKRQEKKIKEEKTKKEKQRNDYIFAALAQMTECIKPGLGHFSLLIQFQLKDLDLVAPIMLKAIYW